MLASAGFLPPASCGALQLTVGALVGAAVGLAGILENMTRATLEGNTAKGRPRFEWLSTCGAAALVHEILA